MIKEIVQDTTILSKKCKPCYFLQLEVMTNSLIIRDMLDTIIFHNNKSCIGLASNQIGENKRIIIVKLGASYTVMVNPIITPIRTAGVKKWKESCLSFPGKRFEKRRYKVIKVQWQAVTGKTIKGQFSKLDAVIIQHEVDHLNGVLV